jgi:hypothetical protein
LPKPVAGKVPPGRLVQHLQQAVGSLSCGFLPRSALSSAVVARRVIPDERGAELAGPGSWVVGAVRVYATRTALNKGGVGGKNADKAVCAAVRSDLWRSTTWSFFPPRRVCSPGLGWASGSGCVRCCLKNLAIKDH